MKKKNIPPDTGRQRFPYGWMALILIVTAICLSPMLNNEFINWDDHGYINENPFNNNLSLKAVFSTYWMANYHPLTMLSYALEYRFFGLEPVGYHVNNFLLHLINTLLVFIFIYRLFHRKLIPAILSALLFGIHPMHVESVVWTSERKDLLYTLFLFWELIQYLNYIDKGYAVKYLLYSAILFLLSLFSKGQAVISPLLMLLIDYYRKRPMQWKLLLEKTAFFILSVIFGIVAIMAQESKEAISTTPVSTVESFFSGFYSFLLYIVKSVVPFRLSGIHPYPFIIGQQTPHIIFFSPLLVLLLFFLTWKYLRKNKEAVFGLGFFVASIFLLLKFVPVSDALIAERYTYVAYVGLFFLFGNMADYLIIQKPAYKKVVTVLLAAYCLFLCMLTWQRVFVWRNSVSFWTDILDKYPNYWRAYISRGDVYKKAGQYDLAVSDYGNAIIHSLHSVKNEAYVNAYLNRAEIYINSLNEPDKAIKDYKQLLSYKPRNQQGLSNLAVAYFKKQDFDSCVAACVRGLQLYPQEAKLHYIKGMCYMNKKEYQLAEECFTATIAADHTYADAFLQRGIVRTDFLLRPAEGIDDFRQVLFFRPNDIQTIMNIGIAYYKNNDFANSITMYNRGLLLAPGEGRFYYLRALAYAAQGKYSEALNDVSKATAKGLPVDSALIASWKKNTGK